MEIQILLHELYQLFPAGTLFIVFILGTVIGSFLNVVIHRLPLTITTRPDTMTSDTFNLAWPPSHCPVCKTAINKRDNIPLISFFLLRGQCRHCHKSISILYPIVECLSGILAVIAVIQSGPGIQAMALSAVSLTLLTLACIDFRTWLLPDKLTLPLLWSGLLYHSLDNPIGLSSYVWGAAAGYLSLWSVYQGFRLLTGKEGMGYGDFKLMAALGAWCGIIALPSILLISSVAGLLFAIGIRIFNPRTKNPSAIPFGPPLAVAGWLTLCFPDNIQHAMNLIFT
ncbi:prepilin peptidase [Oceanospirillum sediminis]|uniref:Prepilin leader peptidase/N-methyltransferase n=1 Tax=Oceanospirillum sediminis TaxID=2760088 RepID=A0A839ILV9_9GAMM|nr:A24 family peptidase [Oceanospirillum sediminis]MBB1485467.1 prepilin peptidase [Oceanospirillum sediminis]